MENKNEGESKKIYGIITEDEAATYADIWKNYFDVELPLDEAAKYLASVLITDSIFGRRSRLQSDLRAFGNVDTDNATT